HFPHNSGTMEKSLSRNYACGYPRCLIGAGAGTCSKQSRLACPRSIGFVQLVIIAGVTVLSFTFKKRPLNIFDRIALLIFAASIFLGGEQTTRRQMPYALIFGAVCVLIAWAIDRLRMAQERVPSHEASG